MAKKTIAPDLKTNHAMHKEETKTLATGSTADHRVQLISHEKFREKILALQNLAAIINDKGDEVLFDGEAKERFIAAFKDGYPVIERTLTSLYELGNFLHSVRARLKPLKLYHTWLDYAGIPRQTAQNYVQAYERYG